MRSAVELRMRACPNKPWGEGMYFVHALSRDMKWELEWDGLSGEEGSQRDCNKSKGTELNE